MSQPHAKDTLAEADERAEPGLADGIRFLYRRRVRLVLRFIVLFSIGIVGLVAIVLTSPTSVQGTLALAFRGIEKYEYPSGRKFSVEGFRSPDVLSKALREGGIPEDRLDVRRLSAGVFVTPVIPADVQARWRKQERDGVRKDEYFPNEFHVALRISGLSNAQHVRLFDALVKSYRERVKYEQRAALSFVGGGWATSYDVLAAKYDFWDIPALFGETFRSLDRELTALITESLQYDDPKYQLGFRDIARELGNWRMIRLSALEAATYEGRLVKNRELTLQRVRYRLEDIDIQIKQKTQEVNEGLRLLAAVDRPNALIAGRVGSDRAPVVDVNALEKLVKNDYVAPVVAKISKLQSETQDLEAERGRLQRQVAVLPKAANVDLRELPAGYQELIQTVSSDLGLVVQNYNRLLDDYLTATISSLVTVKQAPIVVRENFSPWMFGLFLMGMVLVSLFIAIVLVGLEDVVQKIKADARAVSAR
jgi:hypothetical protein